MIRINLLPYREQIKKQMAIRQLIAGGIVFLCLLVAIGIADNSISTRLSAIENQIAATLKTIAALDKRTAEIYQFQKDEKEFQSKLEKIDELNKHRKVPVHILDELAKATPEKLWLTQLSREDASIVLNGIALDQETIVTFLNNLEKSDYFKDVRLIQTQQFTQQNLKLQRFHVTGKVEIPQTKEPSQTGAGGQKLG